MAQEYTFTARVEDGRLKIGLRALQVLREAVKGWRSCPVTVTIEKQHANRSLEQNRAYWVAIVQPLADHTGYSPFEVHEILKAKFLPKRVALLDGNGDVVDEYVIGGSTTKLNKVQFGEFIREIQVWAAEKLGVELQIESVAA